VTVTTTISARQENHGPDLVSSVNTPYLDHGWIPAKQLKPGMHLKTPDGQSAVVVGGSVPAVHDGWMWDLTVPGNNDHDFYVVALPGSGGKADARYPLTDDAVVLVHNATPEQKCTLTLGPGPYAKSGVALVDGNIDGPGVRELINESGEANGCHTCGSTSSGMGPGAWVPDHQPPTALLNGEPQTAYPQCLACARMQGGVVSNLLQRATHLLEGSF
jgi:hypothetical protein